jgi:hypothetical protein
MKLTDLKPGMIVVADEGFTCLDAGEYVVQEHNGNLFIPCRGGENDADTDPGYVERHYLDGQVGDDGELIGLSTPPTRAILIHLTTKELEIINAIFDVVSDDDDENGAVAAKLSIAVAEIRSAPVSVAE